MINFILCDEEKAFSDCLYGVIFNFFMNYDIECNFTKCVRYDDKFEKIVKNDNEFKVYFLSRKIKDKLGIEVARKIREVYHDWTSIIIIVDSSNAYKYSAFSSRLQILDFINKSEDYETVIKEDLEKCISVYDRRPNCLKIKNHYVMNFVEYKSIICIEKEQDSKNCIIKTTYGDKIYHGTLNQLEEKLNHKRFIRTHRSLIVNGDYIEYYDIKENKLVFKDGTYTFLVSRNKKKEIFEYVTVNQKSKNVVKDN